MLNRDIYTTNPLERRLANEGVANVNDERTEQGFSVLRYELDTFVCNGQYEKGMAHILEIYLKNVNGKNQQQPGVWVSGFFGSGKSHLVKMLRALWVDTEFPDGARARGIADLPVSVLDPLTELSTLSKRHGGLHAASGTLGASASGSVRLALMSIVFKSVGLPTQFPVARFVMWLKGEDVLDQVRAEVEKGGHDWEEELDNFYVAEGLHGALCKVKPKVFSSVDSCVKTLNNLYPHVKDISNDDMLKAINQALCRDDMFPLTLIVLDEIQQYIGDNSQRSIDVQEMVEACCKNLKSKLLFIGTGQTAVTGTSNLKRLEGRFTVRVELSDADVDGVIRKVILAKKPEAKSPIDKIMQDNLGEISRHLGGSKIAHQQEDIPSFSQDYPILPVRRRFWEHTLRVLDQTGTDSQLRNQLTMIHKVIQTNLDQPVGHTIPADFFYFDGADKLIQSRTLPRKVHEKTMTWIKGSEDQKLVARACGLIFLINKLASANHEIGIRCNLDTIADLMVEDLKAGSSHLRGKLPGLLDKCELLMKVGDEYRIQTEESQAWNDEFQSHRSNLANESHRVESERDDRIRKMFAESLRKLSLLQGESKVSRELSPSFDSQLPKDSQERIFVWVRDGWSTDENSFRADARHAGQQSPIIFVFIPKRAADGLRESIVNYKAAAATLEAKGVPNSPEGKEAQEAMETTSRTAEANLVQLLDEAFSGAKVFQGGGSEVAGGNLLEALNEAAKNSLTRLYPNFDLADQAGWYKVYEKAKGGAPDSLKGVGYDGEVAKHPVCKLIHSAIAGGKKGADLRSHFEGSPYGWSRDAVDGGLQCLLISGDVRAQDDQGQTLDPRELARKDLGKTFFKMESAVVTAAQKIQIRKLFQKAGFSNIKQGEEITKATAFLQKMADLAESAGGEAPRPQTPSTTQLGELRLLAGNELLLAIYTAREELTQQLEAWQATSKAIASRLPLWEQLEGLAQAGKDLPGFEVSQSQIAAICKHRHLLDNPDPITPLILSLTDALRQELNRQKKAWELAWSYGETRLEKDANVQAMEPEQRYTIRKPHQLTEDAVPTIEVGDTKAILKTLFRTPLSALRDRIAALPSRFDAALLDAAKVMEPKVQEVRLESKTLKNESEIDLWLEEVRKALVAKLKNGPVRPN